MPYSFRSIDAADAHTLLGPDDIGDIQDGNLVVFDGDDGVLTKDGGPPPDPAIPLAALDTDVTLDADSDDLVASQHAVKSYVDDLAGDVNDLAGVVAALPAPIPLSALDTDETLAADSDDLVASQHAVKAYVDANAGGGGQQVLLVKLNGLVKDYDPTPVSIDDVAVLLFDPSAQPWQANHEYSNHATNYPGAAVTPVTSVHGTKFFAGQNGKFTSGSIEPDWDTTPTDGTEERPATWSDLGPFAVWAAETPFAAGVVIFESGSAWLSDGGGDSAAMKPDFSSTETNDTVLDGDITWMNQGPAYGEWSADTDYSLRINTDRLLYGGPIVIPTEALPGVDHAWIGQLLSNVGVTGNSEPDWDAVLPGDAAYFLDGELLWVEDTAGSDIERIALTGIVAPSSTEKLLHVGMVLPAYGDNPQIVLEDQANVESEYDAAAASVEGNRINGGGFNSAVGAFSVIHLMYAYGQWIIGR